MYQHCKQVHMSEHANVAYLCMQACAMVHLCMHTNNNFIVFFKPYIAARHQSV